VLCFVQLATCVRSVSLTRDTVGPLLPRYDYMRADSPQRLDSNYNFSNYTHSVFVLMLWILPINLPVLVVWIRNLTVHWLTPFSSHHNILSIMPFILLIETLSTGRMVPRLRSRLSLLTNAILFSIAAYAAVYGVTYAYVLHHLANILCAWLVAIHFDSSLLSAEHIGDMLDTMDPDADPKKRP
jgi:glycosylphosphatidylinositol deacylase